MSPEHRARTPVTSRRRTPPPPDAACALVCRPVLNGGTEVLSPGSIVGKALEPPEGGVGEILLLLGLQ